MIHSIGEFFSRHHLIGVYSSMIITRLELSKLARKQLKKLPRHIVENLAAWVDDVEDCGLEEVRKITGYHDETLHGNRRSQRSIRLSKGLSSHLCHQKRQLISVTLRRAERS